MGLKEFKNSGKMAFHQLGLTWFPFRLIFMEIYDKGWHFPPVSTPKYIGCWQTLIPYATEYFSFFLRKSLFSLVIPETFRASPMPCFLLILSVWPVKNKRTKFYCSKLQTVPELSSFEEECNPRFTLCPWNLVSLHLTSDPKFTWVLVSGFTTCHVSWQRLLIYVFSGWIQWHGI